jgi:hypothetical protein
MSYAYVNHGRWVAYDTISAHGWEGVDTFITLDLFDGS